MAFNVKIQHRQEKMHFLINKEMDDIFIVFPPMLSRSLEERIFLTKVDNQWKSDYHDRRLVNKLAKEIEFYLSGVPRKKKPRSVK